MLNKEKIMDIYTLHKKGMKINTIAKRLGVNWRTVKKFTGNGFTRKEYESKNRVSQVEKFLPVIRNWLEEDRYKAAWIYDRLKLMGYKGGYDQVRRKVQKVKSELTEKAYIRFETEPGRQAQVDFGEFQLNDEFGSHSETLYLFTMVLGYSRKSYNEFIKKRDMASFLDCHIRAFEHFGGIPVEILYDRMKNVLIRELAGKLEWNKDFYAFCLHYRYKPIVAPPYAAWVKGKVERPINYIRENFWRGYSYRDIKTANQDIMDWNEEKETRVHGTTHERIDVRFMREKPLLGNIPEHRFDTSLKVYRKVHKDCTISYSGNIYVLPHKSAGKNVLLKVKNSLMGAYLDHELLVTYEIPEGKGHFVEDKRFYRELKRDIIQNERKYHRKAHLKGRAKRTLGISTKFTSTIVVPKRPIEEYMRILEG